MAAVTEIVLGEVSGRRRSYGDQSTTPPSSKKPKLESSPVYRWESTPAPPPRTRIGRLRPRRCLAATFSAVAEGRPRPRQTRLPTQLESLAAEKEHRSYPTSGQFQLMCPKEGCRTTCHEQNPHLPRPRQESRPELCVPVEFLVSSGCGGGLGPGLDGLRCRTCGWCLALRVGARWTPLESLLTDTQQRAPGWHPVTSVSDRAALYVLLKYMYGERERSAAVREPMFSPPPVGDSAFLLFAQGGQAVGFATLKRRGQLLREEAGLETFQMDLLDCVFVRRYARRLGLVSSLLLELSRSGQLGIAQPTPAMDHLLRKFLRKHRWARHNIFEVTWTAGEGHRTNIWDATAEEELADAEDLYTEELQRTGSGVAAAAERTPPNQRWSSSA